MIRKLFAGASVVAIAAIAVLLITVGTATTSAKPAEANVGSINATVSSIGVNTFALIQVDAQDDSADFPNTYVDLDITASAGEFVQIDPTFQFPLSGCTDQGYPIEAPCRVNANGFGNSNDFVNGDFVDTLTTLGFATGNTHIQVCNLHDGTGPNYEASPDCNNNTSHVEAWWQAPPGFLGGNVTFCATQTNTKCFTLTVVGPVASLKLVANRHHSTEASTCQDTPVYVIAAAEYTFNNPTSFNNNRAVLCAEARDSNGTLVSGAQLVWATTKGSLKYNPVTTTTSDVDDSSNELSSGSTAHSGDIATVTVTNGSATASTTVQFGGDPASCSIPDFATTLAIGDHAHVKAVFLDSKGNWVPDGIIGHLEEVDSGDGSDNVQFVSVTEDTVKGAIEGDVIGAIAGLTTVAASLEQIAGADVVCTEALELSGDIHLTPVVCTLANTNGILYGFKPPAAGGFGTFAFCGGTYAQLLTASGCPAATSAFFYNKPSGTFAVWIPGSEVAAANAEIFGIFPNEHTPIPAGTIWTAKCKG